MMREYRDKSVAASLLFRYEAGDSLKNLQRTAYEYEMNDFLGAIMPRGTGASQIRSLCQIRNELIGIEHVTDADHKWCFQDIYTADTEPGGDKFDSIKFVKSCRDPFGVLAYSQIDANPLTVNPKPGSAGAEEGMVTEFDKHGRPTKFDVEKYWSWLNDKISIISSHVNPLGLSDSEQTELSNLLASSSKTTLDDARAQIFAALDMDYNSKILDEDACTDVYLYSNRVLYLNYGKVKTNDIIEKYSAQAIEENQYVAYPDHIRDKLCSDDTALMRFAWSINHGMEAPSDIEITDNSPKNVNSWMGDFSGRNAQIGEGLNIYIDGENITPYKAMTAIKDMMNQGVQIEGIHVFISNDNYPMWQYMPTVIAVDDKKLRDVIIADDNGKVLSEVSESTVSIIKCERALSGKSVVDSALIDQMRADHEHFAVNNIMLMSSDSDYLSTLDRLSHTVTYSSPRNIITVPGAHVCVCLEQWNENASQAYAQALKDRGIEYHQIDACDSYHYSTVKYVKDYVLHQSFYDIMERNSHDPYLRGQGDKIISKSITEACHEAQVPQTSLVFNNLKTIGENMMFDGNTNSANLSWHNMITPETFAQYDPNTMIPLARQHALSPEQDTAMYQIKSIEAFHKTPKGSDTEVEFNG